MAAELLMLPRAYQKMKLYPKKCNTEIWGALIGGFKDGSVVIEDIIKFKHSDSSTAHTSPDHKATKQFSEVNEVLIEKVQASYHTHIGISPKPSATDEAMIERLANVYTVTIIASTTQGEYCQVDFFKPIRAVSTDVEMVVWHNEEPGLANEIEQEIKEKVDPYKKTYSYGTSGYRSVGYGKHGYLIGGDEGLHGVHRTGKGNWKEKSSVIKKREGNYINPHKNKVFLPKNKKDRRKIRKYFSGQGHLGIGDD